MSMRLGLAVGFGAGYYLGAKAGRERYEELNRLLDKVRRSEAYETATEKAKAAVDLGVERVRGAAEDVEGADDAAPAGNGTGAPGGRSDLPPVILR